MLLIKDVAVDPAHRHIRNKRNPLQYGHDLGNLDLEQFNNENNCLVREDMDVNLDNEQVFAQPSCGSIAMVLAF